MVFFCHNNNHKLGGLQQQKLFLHSSGGWKSQIKVSAQVKATEKNWSQASLLASDGFRHCSGSLG